jgi:hypothetical protein
VRVAVPKIRPTPKGRAGCGAENKANTKRPMKVKNKIRFIFFSFLIVIGTGKQLENACL